MGDGDHKMFPVSEDLQDTFNFMTGKTYGKTYGVP